MENEYTLYLKNKRNKAENFRMVGTPKIPSIGETISLKLDRDSFYDFCNKQREHFSGKENKFSENVLYKLYREFAENSYKVIDVEHKLKQASYPQSGKLETEILVSAIEKE